MQYSSIIAVNHNGVRQYIGLTMNHFFGVNAANGKVLWQCACCIEGMLYCNEGISGKVVLIEASPKGWSEHGRFILDPQSAQRSPKGKIWTHPVVANGKLYLRDQELIFCFDVKAKKRARIGNTACCGRQIGERNDL